MKKDILSLFINFTAVICICVLTVRALPFLPGDTGELYAEKTAQASMLYRNIFADNFEKAENNNNTAEEDAEESEQVIQREDSDPYSDIAQTPKDIEALMEAETKAIENQEQKGKTSEEEYFGGGTLVSHGNVEVQSKIPDSFYALDIEGLLGEGADLSIKDYSEPTVLVYHSHTTESYTLLDAGYYTESFDLRSEDSGKNMIRVGNELCDYLEKQGIGVIHDTEIHDSSYNDSYNNSRLSVEKYLEEYPSIEITIDLHRDDITYEDGTKVKPTAVVNGKKAARMMLIAGCEYGRVENFPDWEYNLRFDLAVQKKAADMYEGLMRPILFSERKYNMFETKNSFLLEIGTDANTLDEACYSARLFATALGEVIKDYTKDD